MILTTGFYPEVAATNPATTIRVKLSSLDGWNGLLPLTNLSIEIGEDPNYIPLVEVCAAEKPEGNDLFIYGEIPPGARTGHLRVRAQTQQPGTNVDDETEAQLGIIIPEAISPATLQPDTPFTLTGSFPHAEKKQFSPHVFFPAVAHGQPSIEAKVLKQSETEIQGVVPASAKTGHITVVMDGVTAKSHFIVTVQ